VSLEGFAAQKRGQDGLPTKAFPNATLPATEHAMIATTPSFPNLSAGFVSPLEASGQPLRKVTGARPYQAVNTCFYADLLKGLGSEYVLGRQPLVARGTA
jgi:hypothetical protein